MTTINPTQHERSEWARMAQSAYNAGRTDVGHKFSVAAAVFDVCDVQTFDALQAEYREWLIRGTFVRLVVES